MMKTPNLLAVAASFVLLAGCATTAPAPAQTGASGTTGAASAPATSQAPAPGGALSVDEFMAQLKNAQTGVKTYTMDMSMETEMLGKPAKVVMSGAIDQTDPSQPDMSMEMDVAGMKMKLLKVDGAMYIQMAMTGEKWLKVPESQMAQYEGTADSGDMVAGMEKAKAAMKKVTLVGEESVDGVQARHYVITMDSAGLSQLTGSGAKITGDTFDYDIWLDGSGRMHKVAMKVSAEVDGKAMPMTMAGIMGHYDEPVDIKAPAKEDVSEMPR